MNRRIFMHTVAAGGAMVLGVRSASAANYPIKPVVIVVAFPPGGGADTLTRALSAPLAQALGQSVIVENKPGASTVIGADYVAKSLPDGYTLLVTSPPHVSNPSLMDKLPFDTVNDFAPVCLAAKSPFVLVVKPDSPIKALDDLIALAKIKQLTFGSSGNGTSDHLSTEMLCHMHGIAMLHIPYKGTGPALIDLMGGHIDLMFANIVGAAPLMRAGKLRAIAVTTAERSSLLPELPTVQELIEMPFDVSAWTGFLAPAGTDPAIVDRLNREIRSSLEVKQVKDIMKSSGADAVGSTPAEFQGFIVNEINKWSEIIKAAGIKV
ncbi:Bug family tripartite tricarboxylate transporter substrate binding protein [Pollutimonas bauzanensis]|uniref:Tripartite-type tricarboxylate transporter, receptor component TctC n=1 Tax=Pollutimonas bauzanensis TaxID=658167 RepID=A0A1M5XAK0_9BURK|nr:tripartite tricarboxylate transporter substrate binding protein [Pollutimonas bauzanensis]SHH96534.1 Tripartite-type tricarboxylate transporter, receptor component TctC [Pollutimonas bauzanensis]